MKKTKHILNTDSKQKNHLGSEKLKHVRNESQQIINKTNGKLDN
jgi:hypothetical protein